MMRNTASSPVKVNSEAPAGHARPGMGRLRPGSALPQGPRRDSGSRERPFREPRFALGAGAQGPNAFVVASGVSDHRNRLRPSRRQRLGTHQTRTHLWHHRPAAHPPRPLRPPPNFASSARGCSGLIADCPPSAVNAALASLIPRGHCFRFDIRLKELRGFRVAIP